MARNSTSYRFFQCPGIIFTRTCSHKNLFFRKKYVREEMEEEIRDERTKIITKNNETGTGWTQRRRKILHSTLDFFMFVFNSSTYWNNSSCVLNAVINKKYLLLFYFGFCCCCCYPMFSTSDTRRFLSSLLHIIISCYFN